MQQPPYQQSGPYPGDQPQGYQQPYQQPGQYPGSQPQGYQQPYQQPGYPQPAPQVIINQQMGVNPAYAGQQKDWLVALLLCLFGGGFGLHSFYAGKTGIGIIQLFTLGGCWIWAFIDLITIITGSYRDSNGLPLLKKQ